MKTTPLLFLLGLLAAACGGEDASTPAGEDPEEHACEQASETGTALVAAEDTASAPALALAETPYTVTLPSGKPGYLKLQGPSNALLFFGTANVATGLSFGSDATELLPEGAPNEHCPNAIPEHFDLGLDQSGDYFLRLGPSALPSVWLMLTEVEGHAH
ncbi:MAG: hypothetical protein HS104_11290 [Polyangiaceae bacterium]|nr:hypothetical protein [Polyangiaceae bacterium]MCE7891695.1 hypothetical protein [Sorangiineae bacterium PRO1]MCL4748628.1 hypothetical protein [Myxococcales bacterium]